MCLGVEFEMRCHGTCALGEQREGRRQRLRERWHDDDAFARQVQGAAARRQDLDGRSLRQERRQQPEASRHVLAVVQDQQQLLVAQVVGQGRGGVAANWTTALKSAADVDPHVIGSHVSERHDTGAVFPVGRHLVCHTKAQLRLAHAASAKNGYQAGGLVRQCVFDVAQQRSPTDQRHQGCGGYPAQRCLECGLSGICCDALFEHAIAIRPVCLRRGLYAQVQCQRGFAGSVLRLDQVALPKAGVDQHQLAVRLFVAGRQGNHVIHRGHCVGCQTRLPLRPRQGMHPGNGKSLELISALVEGGVGGVAWQQRVGIQGQRRVKLCGVDGRRHGLPKLGFEVLDIDSQVFAPLQPNHAVMDVDPTPVDLRRRCQGRVEQIHQVVQALSDPLARVVLPESGGHLCDGERVTGRRRQHLEQAFGAGSLPMGDEHTTAASLELTQQTNLELHR